MSFAYLRQSLATQSLDLVMQHTIKQSLSLADAKVFPLGHSSVSFTEEQKIETLYIHIPFCHTLCRFCSFLPKKRYKTAQSSNVRRASSSATHEASEPGMAPHKGVKN